MGARSGLVATPQPATSPIARGRSSVGSTSKVRPPLQPDRSAAHRARPAHALGRCARARPRFTTGKRSPSIFGREFGLLSDSQLVPPTGIRIERPLPHLPDHLTTGVQHHQIESGTACTGVDRRAATSGGSNESPIAIASTSVRAYTSCTVTRISVVPRRVESAELSRLLRPPVW